MIIYGFFVLVLIVVLVKLVTYDESKQD